VAEVAAAEAAAPGDRPDRPLARRRASRDALAVDERDVQTVMETLFRIRGDTIEILSLLQEDDDGEEEAEDA
jgi:hypothetical protein